MWGESARRGDQDKDAPPVNWDCGVAATSCRELNRQLSCVAGETTDQPTFNLECVRLVFWSIQPHLSLLSVHAGVG